MAAIIIHWEWRKNKNQKKTIIKYQGITLANSIMGKNKVSSFPFQRQVYCMQGLSLLSRRCSKTFEIQYHTNLINICSKQLGNFLGVRSQESNGNSFDTVSQFITYPISQRDIFCRVFLSPLLFKYILVSNQYQMFSSIKNV